ncbi:hypothetical protein ACGFJ7_26425 [Actinoplanes sp. NPDC048988]|uniref:hypothetical protein n=1 Tax=Actinoplanes sp. NPDC048988 TaxID=3363901 RepID=UPI00371800FB
MMAAPPTGLVHDTVAAVSESRVTVGVSTGFGTAAIFGAEAAPTAELPSGPMAVSLNVYDSPSPRPA